MVLRPLESPAATSKEILPAWPVIERIQRQKCESCWLITQPSHAALAGELAANISAPQFPTPDIPILQAIALHDAGWGIPDAQAIMRSRSVQQQAPESFIATSVALFVAAWEKSIETCQHISPAGGYIVSRHFWRLADHRVKSSEGDSKPDRQKLERFLKNEDQRQKKLAARQELSIEQLEQLTDLLQFCDLLSLYICCSAAEKVAFPEYFGIQMKAQKKIHHQDAETQRTQAVESYVLAPPIIKSGSEFVFAALRHPATKSESSREITVRVE